jgi:hypothetical protein
MEWPNVNGRKTFKLLLSTSGHTIHIFVVFPKRKKETNIGTEEDKNAEEGPSHKISLRNGQCT